MKYSFLLLAIFTLTFIGCKDDDKEPNPELSLTNETLNFDADGISTINTFTVTSSTVWTSNCNQSWCSISPKSGNGITKVTVTVLPNSKYEPQTATITIALMSGDLSKEITITQEAEDAVNVFELIPDDVFRDYCKSFDINHDGKLSGHEARAVTYIDVRDMNISSLEGVEHFTNMNILNCSNTQIHSLDISGNIALTNVSCHSNIHLQSLNVSKNSILKRLECQNTSLQNLDLSGCTELIFLDCCSNQLEKLDVSKNLVLASLYCENNQLKVLDVSKNIALVNLLCYGNQLNTINISGCKKIDRFYCHTNANPLTIWVWKGFDINDIKNPSYDTTTTYFQEIES